MVPVTNEHVKTVTNMNEMAAAINPVGRNKLARTSATRDRTRIGIVARSSCLQPQRLRIFQKHGYNLLRKLIILIYEIQFDIHGRSNHTVVEVQYTILGVCHPTMSLNLKKTSYMRWNYPHHNSASRKRKKLHTCGLICP